MRRLPGRSPSLQGSEQRSGFLPRRSAIGGTRAQIVDSVAQRNARRGHIAVRLVDDALGHEGTPQPIRYARIPPFRSVPAAGPGSQWIRDSIVERLRALVEAMRRARRRSALRRALQSLDDHTLRDIGLHRCEIGSVVAELVGDAQATPLLVADYCPLARMLVLLPWNRRVPLTAQLLRWLILSPPAPGAIATRVPGSVGAEGSVSRS